MISLKPCLFPSHPFRPPSQPQLLKIHTNHWAGVPYRPPKCQVPCHRNAPRILPEDLPGFEDHQNQRLWHDPWNIYWLVNGGPYKRLWNNPCVDGFFFIPYIKTIRVLIAQFTCHRPVGIVDASFENPVNSPVMIDSFSHYLWSFNKHPNGPVFGLWHFWTMKTVGCSPTSTT